MGVDVLVLNTAVCDLRSPEAGLGTILRASDFEFVDDVCFDGWCC